jgi:hypothetical protein
MGRQGNYAGREKKKVKKDGKKISPVTIVNTPTEVEIIRKKRKPREEEEF